MKRTIVVIIAAALLFSGTIVAFKWDEIQLKCVLDRYNRMLDGELPQDLTITIYWLLPYIDTIIPISEVDIMSEYIDFKRIIVVTSEEIGEHLDALKQLNPSTIQVTNAWHYTNVYLYYVVESKGERILSVSLNSCLGTDEQVSAYVNGIKVKPNPALYEAVLCFISEEEREILGLYETGVITKEN